MITIAQLQTALPIFLKHIGRNHPLRIEGDVLCISHPNLQPHMIYKNQDEVEDPFYSDLKQIEAVGWKWKIGRWELHNVKA